MHALVLHQSCTSDSQLEECKDTTHLICLDLNINEVVTKIQAFLVKIENFYFMFYHFKPQKQSY